MELLVQLKEELGRLYIAGSKNAVNDPRIKKYIEPLEKLAEKSKIFEALKVGVSALVLGTEEDSFANLSKVYALVNSVLTTQCELSYSGNEALEIEENDNVYENVLSYKMLESYMTNYYSNLNQGYGAENLLPEYINTFNKDARIYRYVDRYFVGQMRFNLIAKVLYKIDDSLAMYLMQNFESKNTVGCLDRLEYLHNKFLGNKELFDKKVIPLAKKVLEDNHKTVAPEAIEVLGRNAENLDIILGYSKRKSVEYLQSSLTALYNMGVPEFEKAFKEVADKNLDVANDVLLKILPTCKDIERFESYVDLVFDKYLAVLDGEKTVVVDSWASKNQVSIYKELRILSVLSYDKYHTYFEKVFESNILFDEKLLWSNIQYFIHNLTVNDIRYNQLIFDSISRFLKTAGESFKKEKMLLSHNQIYHYYLVVIKNLFDSEKVFELTMDYLQVCKNTEIIINSFDKRKNTKLEYIFINLCKKVDVDNENILKAFNSNNSRKTDYSFEDVDSRIFDFLFNETYIFQNLIGESRFDTGNTQNAIRFTNYILFTKPELKQQYLDKIYDFATKKIQNNFVRNAGANQYAYHFENLLAIDDEDFIRLFFDILLVLSEKCQTVADFNKGFTNLIWLIGYENTNKNYLKYKHVLDDKKYEKLKEYLEQ